MIIKWFLEVLGAFVSAVAGLFSFIPAPPAWITDIPSYVSAVAVWFAGTSPWLPWSLLMTILALWSLTIVAAVTIRLVRIVASFLTAGGGGAA